MGYVHSDRALNLLIALWHDHSTDPDHAGLTPTGPPCHICKPLHVMLGWTWEEYKRWVEDSLQPVRKENTIGTRGIVGVIVDKTAKTSYNHYDSYPEGLGTQVLLSLRTVAAAKDAREGWAEITRQARAVRMIKDGPEAEKPTDADKAALAEYLDTRVSEGTADDWYALTRHLQGKLLGMLQAGYMVDAEDFPRDSLFCEWGYVLNLDEGTFEVYKGFIKEPHDDGFWGGLEPLEKGRFSGYEYHSIRRVAAWSLIELPTDEQFLAAFARPDDED